MKPSQIAYVYLLSTSWGSPPVVTSQVLEREYNIPPQQEAPQKVHASSSTHLSDKSIRKARWQHARILQSEDNEASTIMSMSMPMFTLTKSYRYKAQPDGNVGTAFSMSMQMEETISVDDGEVDTAFFLTMQVDGMVDDDDEIDPTDEWSRNEIVTFVDATTTSIASTTTATTDETTDATTGATIDATIDATTDVTTTPASIASPIARPSARPTKVATEDIESATTDQLIQNMVDTDYGATTGNKPGRNGDGRRPSQRPVQDGARPAREVVGRNNGSKGSKGGKKTKAR